MVDVIREVVSRLFDEVEAVLDVVVKGSIDVTVELGPPRDDRIDVESADGNIANAVEETTSEKVEDVVEDSSGESAELVVRYAMEAMEDGVRDTNDEIAWGVVGSAMEVDELVADGATTRAVVRSVLDLDNADV